MAANPGGDRLTTPDVGGGFNTSPTGSRERPPDELNKVVELLWFCERDVWSELTGVWRSRASGHE